MPASRKKAAARTPARAAAVPARPAPDAAPVAASPATRAKPAKAAAQDKVKDNDKEKEKAKKTKLVRDSFTIPKAEYAVLDALKQRAAKAGAPSKKSEVLRAGIKALAALSDADFLAAMGAVPSLKTGRPAKQ